jgi:hypothetical protein
MPIGPIWQFMPIRPDPDPQNFSGQTIPCLRIVKFFEDFLQMKNLFDQKLQFTQVQAKREDFSPQERTSSPSKK